jgi:hypothetical protein
MTLPNFLIIGAAKSGTTSLWAYLRQHPQIFLSGNKEPNFFAFEGLKLPPFVGPAEPKILYDRLYKYSVTDLKTYRHLFKNVSSEIAIGEASVRYLYFPQAAERIKKYIPDVKTIAILRNPIDRLYSHYLMIKAEYRLEPLKLAEALDREEERIKNNWGWDWHYVKVGMYYQQIKHYLDLFSREQVKIFLYEDFCSQPLEVVREICGYLGVDNKFVPNIANRRKEAYWPKIFAIDRLLNEPNPFRVVLEKTLPKKQFDKVIRYGMRLNSASIPPMPDEIRDRLKKVFREDILKLQDLIQREISWL